MGRRNVSTLSKQARQLELFNFRTLGLGSRQQRRDRIVSISRKRIVSAPAENSSGKSILMVRSVSLFPSTSAQRHQRFAFLFTASASCTVSAVDCAWKLPLDTSHPLGDPLAWVGWKFIETRIEHNEQRKGRRGLRDSSLLVVLRLCRP